MTENKKTDNFISVSANDRQVFWDSYIVDREETTAALTLHHPIRKEEVLKTDFLWEGDGCTYYNIMHDGDVYRMYYTACRYAYRDRGMYLNKMPDGTDNQFYICYAESKDGLHWTKPDLGVVEYMGGKANNIVMAATEDISFIDACYVFVDTNPECPSDEKYKAVVMEHHKSDNRPYLYCYVGSDAIHLKKGWIMQNKGAFDSLNTAMWDEQNQIYHAFLRGKHKNNGENSIGENRDIRHMVSKDFRTWSEPEIIQYNDRYEFEMYTNVISKYYRAKNVFVGFPTRYVERSFSKDYWTDNYEQFKNKEWRKYLINTVEPRIGLSVTDCLFMVSHDGDSWQRFNEAYVTPGEERKDNWVYGDCYPSCGMIETEDEYGVKAISMYFADGHFSGKCNTLVRYAIRLDGFASYRADFEQRRLVTKPLKLYGDELEINFSTSAIGNVYVRVLDENKEPIDGFASCELFGDSTERRVKFDRSLRELQGKTVHLEFLMSDADIYSFVLN